MDASPGKHTASASTEVASNVDIQVVAGQTHYVRSAIGMGLLVGRVVLSVEGMITAKGELSSVERLDGTVVSNTTPLAGDLDSCAPPGGWGRPDMMLGMRWSVQYKKPGGSCSGDFELQGQMVSDEIEPTPFGDLKVQRIDYKGGTGLRGQFPLMLEARVWHSPVLGRVVRFESEFAVRTGRIEPAGREKVELVAIRRD